MKGVFLSTRIHKVDMHETGFNHEKVINPKRGVWFRGVYLTKRRWLTHERGVLTNKRWLTLRVYGYPKKYCVWSKDSSVVYVDYWVIGLRVKVEGCFDLNCTKVYEWRWILWIVGSSILYPKVFRIRIWILPLIPSPLLKARGAQFASEWSSVLKLNKEMKMLFLRGWHKICLKEWNEAWHDHDLMSSYLRDFDCEMG